MRSGASHLHSIGGRGQPGVTSGKMNDTDRTGIAIAYFCRTLQAQPPSLLTTKYNVDSASICQWVQRGFNLRHDFLKELCSGERVCYVSCLVYYGFQGRLGIVGV
jgi:hypothetical protein